MESPLVKEWWTHRACPKATASALKSLERALLGVFSTKFAYFLRLNGPTSNQNVGPGRILCMHCSILRSCGLPPGRSDATKLQVWSIRGIDMLHAAND